MTDAEQRRLALIRWIRERPAHNGLTASEIVDVIGHPYPPGMQGRYDKCHADLKILETCGLLQRYGRPARWTLT